MDRKPFHGKKLRFQFVSLPVVLSFKLLPASLPYCQPSWVTANECIGVGKYSTGNDAFERWRTDPDHSLLRELCESDLLSLCLFNPLGNQQGSI
ncbi:MAG TPA: hypothetical protein DCR17_13295 [Verrucomicrobiales bacterium]|nr:hypothetical protein [Verrucomicrobiae bacterium]HAO67647.1 hypothetical protein [Verrucomicrobiales bacterium]HAQ99157.1 hypothetical protein [Verrucomicrobiales bacterium]HAW00309.1 hypothetical protein [Verrucomicrobiales bacterium]HCP36429.1 hypothetical protein [Verrucomicrobiales bacterium]